MEPLYLLLWKHTLRADVSAGAIFPLSTTVGTCRTRDLIRSLCHISRTKQLEQGSTMSRQDSAREYHLICRVSGESHGGFETLSGARQYAREERLEGWDIFLGNRLVERREAVWVESQPATPKRSRRKPILIDFKSILIEPGQC
jgi:hypothetical protein